MAHPFRKITQRLGRRGAVLLLLGVLWVIQGIGIGTSPPTREAGAAVLFHEQLPIPVRVVLWTGTGLIACRYAFRSSCSPGADGPGFVALVIMPIERAASFLWGFVLYLAPGVPGYPRGLIGFATWTTTAALIIVISGWADPRNRAVTHPADP